MGACSFRNSGRGRSAQTVFTNLQENAISEYGYDIYNGTISTVPGYRDITNEWKNSKKDLETFINDKLDNSNKYDCFCICVEEPKSNPNKTKSQVEHFVSKGTKKWILKYVVYCYDLLIGAYSTKGEAVKAARAHTEKHLSSTTIVMEKSIEKGNAQVARVTYKRSDKEKDGKWIFFGWAAE